MSDGAKYLFYVCFTLMIFILLAIFVDYSADRIGQEIDENGNSLMGFVKIHVLVNLK